MAQQVSDMPPISIPAAIWELAKAVSQIAEAIRYHADSKREAQND